MHHVRRIFLIINDPDLMNHNVTEAVLCTFRWQALKALICRSNLYNRCHSGRRCVISCFNFQISHHWSFFVVWKHDFLPSLIRWLSFLLPFLYLLLTFSKEMTVRFGMCVCVQTVQYSSNSPHFIFLFVSLWSQLPLVLLLVDELINIWVYKFIFSHAAVWIS